MSIKALVSAIAAVEGKKSQASIGDIREIVAIIADMIGDDPEILYILDRYAADRKRKRKRK